MLGSTKKLVMLPLRLRVEITLFLFHQLFTIRNILAAYIFLAVACNEKATDQQVKGDVTHSSRLYIPSDAVSNFQGTYTGSFDDGYMTLVLNYVNGKNASGFNIHKGNRRNINGTVEHGQDGCRFIMKEPG